MQCVLHSHEGMLFYTNAISSPCDLFIRYVQMHVDKNGLICYTKPTSRIVACDDALQTGVGCVECLDETNMLLKYF